MGNVCSTFPNGPACEDENRTPLRLWTTVHHIPCRRKLNGGSEHGAQKAFY